MSYSRTSAEADPSAEHDLWRPTVGALGVVGQAPVRDNNIPSWYGAVGVNINIPVFNGFLYNARAKVADLQTEADRQKLLDTRNNIARDVLQKNMVQDLGFNFKWNPTEHWAFQAVVQPRVPAVRDGAWVRNPVDAFVAAEVGRVLPAHCTGWKAVHQLARALPEAFVQPAVGTVITV